MAVAGAAAIGGVSDELALAIVNARGARSDAREGVWGKRVHVAASPAGIAFVGEKMTHAYPWEEVESTTVRRGSIVVRLSVGTPRTRVIRLVVDDVDEPHLSKPFLRVLDELRAGTFAFNGTSWFEYQNASDRLRSDFQSEDDQMLAMVAGAMWVILGFVFTVFVAVALNAAQARGVPAGTFSVGPRVGPADPRVLVAAFALSALVTGLILRFAVGANYLVWARGIARGWGERGSRWQRFAQRQLGRVLLATQSSAIVLLLALLAFWPTIAVTTLIGQSGIRHEVPLPVIGFEERWQSVKDITLVEPTNPNEPKSVRYTFTDGRVIIAEAEHIGGGTPTQLYNVSSTWWRAALRP